MFEKRTIVIGGRTIPAIVISEPVLGSVTLRNGQVRPTQTVQMLSLRETNPDNGPVETYLAQTPENLRFAPLRFTTVKGLDVDEHGAQLGIEVLMARLTDNIIARQLARAATIAPVEVDLDSEDEGNLVAASA